MYKSNNLIIIGCGPHFRSKYFKMLFDKIFIEKSIQISLVIDLESQKEKILRFYNENNVSLKSLFISDRFRNHISVSEIEDLVKDLVDLSSVNSVMICTEPKSHKAYINWAAIQGFDIFVDKPITAFNSFEERHELYTEYKEIEQVIRYNKINCVVSCERRKNIGYKEVFDFLNDFVKTHELPISDIDIHFSGGTFLLPEEELQRENHPFRYGYGVLLHSGYHYVDLLANLLKINLNIFDFSIDNVNIKSQKIKFNESFNPYVKKFSSKFFQSYKENSKSDINYGESNFSVIGTVHENKTPITNFSLRLLSCGTTLRKYNEVNKDDLNMLEGRLRQEFVIIHLNPACSIHISSNPYDKLGCESESNFSIKILQNNYFSKNGPEYISIDRVTLKDRYNYDTSLSLNTEARREQLYDFLAGKDGNSSFQSHEFTVQLLDKIYKSL